MARARALVRRLPGIPDRGRRGRSLADDSLLRRSLLAPLLLVCVAAACGGGDPAADTPAERVLPVTTTRVGTQDVRSTIEAVGTVYASAEVEIRPQVDGVLARAPFVEGQSIEAGAEVFALDDSKATAALALEQAQLDSARAKVAVATERLERYRRLIAESLVSREEYETLEAEYLAAAAAVREHEAAVRLAMRELEDYHIRAPFSGTMSARMIDVGNYVEQGAVLSKLLQTDPAEVRFGVPERYNRDLEVGRTVTVTGATGEQLAEGTVRFIDPSIDPSTRMLQLEAQIANAGGMLRPGQFVGVSLLLDVRPQQVVVPEEAIVPYGGKTWVFVVDGEVARRREVTLGAREPGVVEIHAGLEPGDTIVVTGQHRLSDEAKVSVQADRTAAGDAPAPLPGGA